MSSRSSYFSVHSHSHFSALDGMSKVQEMVKRAHQYKHPALAITDHGNMSATVQAYTECVKYGMKFFPGVEGYLIDPAFQGELDDKECGKAGRYHLGLLAATEDGYKALVDFVSMTHTRPRFNRFPRFTLSDLAELGQEHGDDLVLTTGCFFGWFQQALLKEGEAKAARILSMYSQWFPNTYVEVQNHNIVHDEDPDEDSMTDDQLVKTIIGLADEANLPVLATQDSHYTDQSQKRAHELMKDMTFGGANEFPGDSFHLASSDWVREHYTDDQWDRFEEAYEELLDLHDVRIKPLDTYKPDVPTTVDDPMDYVRHRTKKALRKLGLTKPKYQKQAEFELDVIEHLGMGSYFVICEDVAKFCKQRGICLEVRGSANGSLVLYALGVTSVDPVVWGGDFERFLSKDRTKPPDVDFDVEDVGRAPLLQYLMGKYKAYQIGTWSQMGIRTDQHTGEEKGSILVSWQMSKRRQCEEDAWALEQAQAAKEGRKPVKYKAVDEGKHRFAYKYGWVKTIDDVRKVSPKEYRGLKLLSKMDVYRSYGVHAAGVLLSGDNIAVEEYVPRMLVASSDTCVVGDTELSLVGRKSSRTVEEVYRILHGRYGEGSDTECFGCKATLPVLKQPRHANHTDARLCQACKNVKSRIRKRGLTVEGRSVDGTIKPEKLVDVIYTGVRPVYRVQLASGHVITATADHRHLTDAGWKRVEKLHRGDRVAIRGSAEFARRTRRVSRRSEGKDNAFSRRLVLDVATRAGRVCEHCGAPEPEGRTHDMAHKTYEGERTADQFLYLCRTCHIEFDEDSRGGKYSAGVPIEYSEIVSIRSAGTKPVYDVSMDSPDHSWVANGIVTHNCVTQFDMDDVEQLGLLKLDVLGQATLTVMRVCQELIGISDPTDFSWIPLDDPKAMKECKTGRTDNGLFHLSGYTKAKGAREMKVRNTKDLILLQALYMPGCMDVAPGQSISQKDLYLKRRRSMQERSKITYLGPEFESALKDTYGAVIFQEQVINIMRNLGMSIESINKFFKVVKDSGKGAVERNAARMAEVRDEFDEHCEAAGIDPEAAWNQTAAFVSYGFNKNHATGYGIRTYRTAYLKAHYPLEYMTALLIAWAGRTKEKDYIAEARHMEIPILAPDVNISKDTWTLDRRRKAIRRGLVTITGIGAATALQISSKAPFTDLDDMCYRVRSVSGTKAWIEENKFSGAVEHLRKAGALKSLGVKPE